jgi:hypothetical protein
MFPPGGDPWKTRRLSHLASLQLPSRATVDGFGRE